MNDRIEYNNGSFDVYTNDSGWLDFLSSLSYFYAGKPKQLPSVKVHFPEQVVNSSIEKEIEDLYEVTNADSFASDLVRFYGTTDDIGEVGYILQDGSALDFSGRHLKYGLIKWGFVKGKKGITHDTIQGINTDDYCLTSHYRELLWSSKSFTMAIMNNCKAVRVGIGHEDVEPFIQVVSTLTQKQIEKIDSLIHGQSVLVDCIDEKDLPVMDKTLTISVEALTSFNNEIKNHGII